MNGSGQLPADDFYFAQDMNGNGASNPAPGFAPAAGDPYVYYYYAASADR